MEQQEEERYMNLVMQYLAYGEQPLTQAELGCFLRRVYRAGWEAAARRNNLAPTDHCFDCSYYRSTVHKK